jgi:uncharacterized membrane protein YagU involved in acid resistance
MDTKAPGLKSHFTHLLFFVFFVLFVVISRDFSEVGLWLWGLLS